MQTVVAAFVVAALLVLGKVFSVNTSSFRKAVPMTHFVST